MSAELTNLGFSNLTARLGSHIAYPFDDEEQRKTLLLSYIAEGLQRNEKCITAVSEYPIALWVEGLRTRGIDIQSVIGRQLTILTPQKLFGSPTDNRAVKPADEIKRTVVEALNERWQAVRVCTSLSHLYHNEKNLHGMLREEGEANRILANHPALLLCTYDKSHLQPEVFDLCIQQHPLITDGNSLTPNAALPADDPKATVDRLSRIRQTCSTFRGVGFRERYSRDLLGRGDGHLHCSRSRGIGHSTDPPRSQISHS